MSHHQPNLKRLTKDAVRTADFAVRSATEVSRPLHASTMQCWSDIIATTSRQLRSNIELSEQIVASRSLADIKQAQETYLTKSLADSVQSQMAFLSLAFPAFAITDVAYTREAIIDSVRAPVASRPDDVRTARPATASATNIAQLAVTPAPLPKTDEIETAKPEAEAA